MQPLMGQSNWTKAGWLTGGIEGVCDAMGLKWCSHGEFQMLLRWQLR